MSPKADPRRRDMRRHDRTVLLPVGQVDRVFRPLFVAVSLVEYVSGATPDSPRYGAVEGAISRRRSWAPGQGVGKVVILGVSCGDTPLMV